MDVSTLPSGIYRITRHPALPMADGDSLVVEITLLRNVSVQDGRVKR